jgi:integrase
VRGSVYREPGPRTWAFVVDVPAGGRRRQLRRRGFPTKAAAAAALAETIASSHAGNFVEPSRMPLGQWLDRWLSSLPAAGLRPSTVDGYHRTLARYVAGTALAALPLRSLTAADLDAHYNVLATTGRQRARAGAGPGLSLRTVRYVHAILHRALADAERQGLLARNPAAAARPPATAATRPPEASVWTPRELATFLEQTAQHRFGPLFHLAAMTGLRRGELCGLRWSDVDLHAGSLVVRRSVTTVAGRPVAGAPKTARGRRVVDLDPGTVAVLRDHRRRQLAERLRAGGDWVDHDLVFCEPTGEALDANRVSDAFRRAVRQSGLPRITFHGLRHTHATHLLAAGTNVRVVAERLGHHSAGFTLDRYGHVLAGQQSDAARAVAALVRGDSVTIL